jgi:hypothetical protein
VGSIVCSCFEIFVLLLFSLFFGRIEIGEELLKEVLCRNCQKSVTLYPVTTSLGDEVLKSVGLKNVNSV